MSFFQRLGGLNIPKVHNLYLNRRSPTPYGLIDEMGDSERDPEPGLCLEGDATNIYVDLDRHFSFIENTGVFKIKVDVKLKDISTDQIFIGSTDQSSGNSGFQLGFDSTNGNYYFYIETSTGTQKIDFTGSYTFTNWNQIEVEADGIDITCIVNGTQDTSQSINISLGIGGTLQSAALGSTYAGSGSKFLNGFIHDAEIIDPQNSSNSGIYYLEDRSGKIAKDSSGNGYHGTINGDLSIAHAVDKTVPYSFANEQGLTKYKGLKFDGSNNYVDTGNKFDFIHQTGIFEIENEILVYKESDYNILGNKSSNLGFVVDIDSSLLRFTIGNGNNEQTVSSNTIINDGIKHKIKVTSDGTDIKLYVDENLEKTQSITITLSSNTANNNVTIGKNIDKNWFNGLILNCKIKNLNNLADNLKYNFSKKIYGTQVPNLLNPHSQGIINGGADKVQNNVPQNQFNKSLDADGNTLEFRGRTAYNGRIKGEGCIYGEGVNHYADFIQNISLSGEIEVMGWFQIPSTISQTAKGYLLDGSGFFEIAFNNGFVDYRGVQGSLDLKDDKWHHFRFKRKDTGFGGSLIEILIDGAVEHRTYITESTGTIERIFANASSLGDYYEGYLFDLRVFNAHKTDAEIEEIKQGYDLDSDLIAHLPMQEGGGNALYDISGNYKHIYAVNFDVSIFWSTQNLISRNNYKGFTKYGSILSSSYSFSLGNRSEYDLTLNKKITFNFLISITSVDTSIGGELFIKSPGGKFHPSSYAIAFDYLVSSNKIRIRLYKGGNIDGNINTNISSYEDLEDLYKMKLWSFVIDNSTGVVEFYVDGILSDSYSYTPGDFSNSDPLLCLLSDNGGYVVDNISIFDDTLTQTEIQELYNAAGDLIDPLNHSRSSVLIGNWRNEGNKDWVDRSTKGYDAIKQTTISEGKVPAITDKLDAIEWKPDKVPQRNLVDGDITIDFLSNEPDSPWANDLISINNSIDSYQRGDVLSNPLFKKTLSDNDEKNILFEESPVSGQKLNKIERITD